MKRPSRKRPSRHQAKKSQRPSPKAVARAQARDARTEQHAPRNPARPKPRPGAQKWAPTKESMVEMLSRCGIGLDDKQVERLWAYHNLVRKRNQDQELTRLIGFETIVMKHYVDSMIVGDLFPLPSPIVDIGTGAGFPGIPLKIRFPKLELILAEPRPKRVKFLQEAIKVLGLNNTSIFPHRVVSRSFQQPVKGVITRAVETMDKTLARTSACVQEGGFVIFMKGPNCGAEIKDCKSRFKKQYKVIHSERYSLPGTPHERRLVVWERLLPPEIPKD